MTKNHPKLKKTLVELAKQHKISPKQLQEMVELEQFRCEAPDLDLSDRVKKGKVTFGVISETRLNSKYMRPDVIKTLYEQFRRANVSYVFHLGNITDGWMRYKGHTDDTIFHNYGQMFEKLFGPHPEIGYPNIGVKTYFIGGNFDLTYSRRLDDGVKTNVCRDIATFRKDLEFLGYNAATVKISPKTTVRLSHPLPGIGSKKPYTISYPLQKKVATFAIGQKPEILLVGYFGRRFEFIGRDIEAHLIGSAIGQTDRESEQELPAPSVGGTIFDVYFNKEGSKKKVITTDIPFHS